jgi:hypothetical protein
MSERPDGSGSRSLRNLDVTINAGNASRPVASILLRRPLNAIGDAHDAALRMPISARNWSLAVAIVPPRMAQIKLCQLRRLR